MKNKITIGLAATSLALLVSACSQTADPVGSSDESKKSDLTLEEVFTKSIEAGEDINSLKADMMMNQEISISELPEPMIVNSKIQLEAVMEPLALYQTIETTPEGPLAEEGPTTIESYMTEDGFFMYDATSEQWMKMPSEMSDEILALSQQQNNPNEQLKQLEQFTEDFTFEQDDSSYILILNASEEKFSEFLIEQTREMMPDLGMGVSIEELFQDTTFEDVMYEIVIDKETFLPSDIKIDMTMKMMMEDQEMSITQQTETNYQEYNTIDEITIPQEVLDEAVEMPY